MAKSTNCTYDVHTFIIYVTGQCPCTYLYVHKRNGCGGVKIVKYDIPIIDTSVPKEKSHGGGRLIQPAADFEVLYVFSDYGLDTRIQIA